MKQSKFRLTAELSPADFLYHPVWVQFEDPDDFDLITSWGVDGAWLKKELRSFDGFNEGYTHPFYPLLDFSGWRFYGYFVGARFTLSNGHHVQGYVADTHCFAWFLTNGVITINKNQPELAKKAAFQLQQAFSASGSVFPMNYTLATEVPGRPIDGVLDSFW